MTDREKELVNRYVYEVTKEGSRKEQRNEIEMELRELIEKIWQKGRRLRKCS